MTEKKGKTKKDKPEKTGEKSTKAPAALLAQPGGFPTWLDLVAMLGIFLAATLIGGLCMMILSKAAPNMQRELVTVIVYSLQFSLAIGGVVFYRRARGGDSGLRFAVKWYNAALVLLGIVLILAVSVVMEPLLNLFPERYFEQLDKVIGRGGWSILLTVALAPVFEEVLFRGLVLESARQKWGASMAILVSAVFFGLVHFPNVPQMINAFVMGVVMGYIYVLTDSLVSVILIHAVNNGLAYMIMEITGTQSTGLRTFMENSTMYWVIYAVCLVVFVVSLVAMALIATDRMRKRSEITAVFNAAPEKETLPGETAGEQ